MKLRKGDEVRVLAGKELGKEGTITRVVPERNLVFVEGVNLVKKHQRQTRATLQGGIIDKEMPVHISNVALLHGSCGAVRVGYRFANDGKKIRVCRKCGSDV